MGGETKASPRKAVLHFCFYREAYSRDVIEETIKMNMSGALAEHGHGHGKQML